MADWDVLSVLRRNKAGLRNALDVMRDVNIKERRRNGVGILAIAGNSTGGFGASVTATL